MSLQVPQTRDTDVPPLGVTAILGSAAHRWLTAIGPITGNEVWMNIDIAEGGLFDTPVIIQYADPKGSDGTAVLTFDSCGSGTVEYDIPPINRQGIIPIQRVANDNITLCEALMDQLHQSRQSLAALLHGGVRFWPLAVV